MANDEYRNEKYYFRMVDLKQSDVEDIKRNIGDYYKFQVGKYRDTQNHVVLIELSSDENYKELIEFVLNSQSIGGKHGFFISLVTDQDSDGLSVPAFIAQLFREVGGNLDFSFTSV